MKAARSDIFQNEENDAETFFGIGLHNYGNTCFINATLQGLMHTEPFALNFKTYALKYVNELKTEPKRFKSYKKLFAVTYSLVEVFMEIYANKNEDKCKELLKNFIIAFKQHLYSNNSTLLEINSKNFNQVNFEKQQDACEFLMTLLRTIQEEADLNCEDDDYNVLNNIAFISEETIITCPNECYSNKQESISYCLQLGIPAKIGNRQTITECFETANEKLVLTSVCENCNVNKITIYNYINEPPTVLIVNLKRFNTIEQNNSIYTFKSKENVLFAPILHVNKFKQNTKYKLSAIICHIGDSLLEGHYIAYCRLPFTNKWNYYADCDVHRVENLFDNQSRDYRNCVNNAYILIYSLYDWESKFQLATNICDLSEMFSQEVSISENLEYHTSSNFAYNLQQENCYVTKTETIKSPVELVDTNDADILSAIEEIAKLESGLTICSQFMHYGCGNEKHKFIYHSDNKNSVALSGMHALNNVLQKTDKKFETTDYAKFKTSKKEENLIDEDDSYPPWSLDVVLNALKINNIKYECCTNLLAEKSFRESTKKASFLVFYKNTNLFEAVCRFFDDNILWIMHSKGPKAPRDYWRYLYLKQIDNVEIYKINTAYEEISMISEKNFFQSNSSITVNKIDRKREDTNRTKIDAILKQIIEIDVLDDTSIPSRYQKALDYKIAMYETYCECNGLEAWPVGDCFIFFLRWLDENRFAPSYITDFYFGILRVAKAKCNYEIPPLLKKRFQRTLLHIQRHPTNKEAGAGSEPFLVKDIMNIIDAVPECYQTKEYMASLLLFGIYTGSRSITIRNMKICDIKNRLFDYKNETLLLKINITTMKGQRNMIHPVTFRCPVKKTNNGNFIYWLRRYLLQTFDVDICDTNLNLQSNDNFIWLPRSAYYCNYGVFKKKSTTYDWILDNVKRFSIMAGYKSTRFTPHSLRSGHMTSALIAHYNKNIPGSVYLNTSLIANWAYLGQSQLKYLKSPLKRAVLCENVALGKKELMSYNMIDSVKIFHGLDEEPQSIWPTDTNIKGIKHCVNSIVFTQVLRPGIPILKHIQWNYHRKIAKIWASFINTLLKTNYNSDYALKILKAALNDEKNEQYEEFVHQVKLIFISSACDYINNYIAKEIKSFEFEDNNDDNQCHASKIEDVEESSDKDDIENTSTMKTTEINEENMSSETDQQISSDDSDDSNYEFDAENNDCSIIQYFNAENRKAMRPLLARNCYIREEWINCENHDLFRNRHLKWAERIYEKWLSTHNKTLNYPLDCTLLCKFINDISSGKIKYEINTLCTIINSLKNKNLIETGGLLDSNGMSQVVKTLKQLRKNAKSQKKDGQTPITFEDLNYMFQNVEKSSSHADKKYYWYSLYLFAFYTGSRSITCVNVKLKDIQVLEIRNEDNRKIAIVTITQQVQKADSNWRHPVSFEGYLDVQIPMCFIYYLNEYLIRFFDTDLEKMHSNKLHPNKKELYLWSSPDCALGKVEPYEKLFFKQQPKNVSEQFTRFSNSNGFINVTKVSLHSFRSGFLTSAIFNNNLNRNNIDLVLGHVAIIAGWHPQGKFVDTYMKYSTHGSIVANYAVNYTENTNTITNELAMEPTFRHNLKLELPKNRNDENMNSLYAYVANILHQNDCDAKAIRNFWRSHAYKYYINNFDHDDEFQKKVLSKCLNKTFAERRQIYNQEGYQYLSNHMRKLNDSEFNDLKHNFLVYIHRFLENYNPNTVDQQKKQRATLEEKNPCSYKALRAYLLKEFEIFDKTKSKHYWNYAALQYLTENHPELIVHGRNRYLAHNRIVKNKLDENLQERPESYDAIKCLFTKYYKDYEERNH